MVYDGQSNTWSRDNSLQVTCVSSYILISSPSPSVRFHVPLVMGRYSILPGLMCNNHVIYKHLHNDDRYLYVDETDKWQVSNGEELYGLGVRQVACSRFGYVHGGQVPAGDVP